MLLTVIPGAPLRNPETDEIIGDSPFMDSLIVIIAMIFLAAGWAYGRGAGTIKGREEVIDTITKSWASLASLLFLFLLIAQFIAYFNFSNIAEVAAVKLGDMLEDLDIGAIWLLIGVIFVTIVVDLIIPQAIAKWAMLAPIFMPLFLRLGVAPQTVLAAYRVGDSPVNVITPLMAYFPLIVVFAQRYKKDAGIGTVVSMMLPYAVILSILWIAVLRRLVLDRHPARAGLAGAYLSRLSGPATRRAAVSDTTITFLVLAAVVVVFVLEPAAGRVVALGAALALWATGVLDLDQALAGFGDPTVIFIASLFVVSEASTRRG